MDFRFNEEEEKFRQEVRDFIKAEFKPELACSHPHTPAQEQYFFDMKKKMGARGWHSLAWPKEAGGQGSVVKQFIVSEEFYLKEMLGPDIISNNMVAPTIIAHGSEEQKKKYLPKIASGETTWCQGFSEPEAGSDLFSMRATAVEQGDDWVINGQKVWTSQATLAGWMFLLARTEPDPSLKHRGVSAFVVDMKSPGVEVAPLRNTGEAFFCEVFFDNVKIPKDNLVGKKNKGAAASFTMLGYERSGIHRTKFAQACAQHLVDYAKTTKRNGKLLMDDPAVRRRIADVVIEGEAATLLAYRVLDLQMKGENVDYLASISRLAGTVCQAHVAEASLDILGQYLPLDKTSELAPSHGAIMSNYLYAFPGLISAGTSEIQRNIIAERGLKLPASS